LNHNTVHHNTVHHNTVLYVNTLSPESLPMLRMYPSMIDLPSRLVCSVFVILWTVFHGLSSEGIARAAEDRPNVVIVISDDQGYGDLSCHGNPVLKTPEIDRLFSESIRLTDYHVSPTCSPTRAALLTGHWTNRTGVWHTIMGRSMLRENEVTLGQLFHDAGYRTGMFGKWHLGDNFPYRPEDRGFDEVHRHGGGGVGQTPDYWDNAYFDGAYWHNGKIEPADGFCTDVFFDSAKRFIADQQDAGQPFLAYIAPNAPHGPMHCPPQYSAPYEAQGTHVANFYGMIANIDHNVGQLREFLQQRGLAENTIFIFTTDNGTSSGAKIFNSGMRGAKGSQFDGGHRVPFFLRWPAGGFDQARDIVPITAHVDVVPTLLELCDIPAPDDIRFDGVSIVPLLRGEDQQWPDRILVTDSQRVKDPVRWKQSAVMTSRWRLINGRQLYDVQVDPGQTRDVASGYPDVVSRLTNFYQEWWAELEPTFSQETAIYLGAEEENPARLTSHDWITSGATPWNQSHVRAGKNGPKNTGYWNVNVVQPGNYRIRLRRWPEEVDVPIVQGLPAGDDVPGERPFRATPGESLPVTTAFVDIGQIHESAAVGPSDREVVFDLVLPAGLARLETSFTEPSGERYGAYFVYVERLDTQ
jgi:arylsulfatase B